MGTLETIDFHTHSIDPVWLPDGPPPGSAVARSWRMLTNIDAQLAAMDAAGVDARVLTAPVGMVAPRGDAPEGLTQRINERFAQLVAAHPTRLLALATIDAFSGDAAAREAERAVTSLGLGGICIDCARGERFLDAAECRPTLELAARFGVPVFVHPVSPAGYTEHLRQLGHAGVLMARGTEAAAGVYALVRSGVLASLPDLTIVMPLIAGTLLLFAGIIDAEASAEEPRPSRLLKRLYIDTMGCNAEATRYAIAMLGAGHVLSGSDWPILPLTSRPQIETMLDELDLSPDDRTAILGGTTRRLLTGRTPSTR